MILKDVDSFSPRDKFEMAGQKAESQMAFYLRRAFAEDPQVHVIHSLRLEHKGEVVQMDHLVMHPWGWILIESKSVTTEVDINEHGEWSRKWNGHWQGMPSPTRQVQRQLELFNALMDTVIPQVLVRRFAVFGDFKSREFQQHTFVAISDHGRITGSLREQGVLKADQVVDAVREAIKQTRKASRALLSLRTYAEFPADRLKELAEHLIGLHQPLRSSHPVLSVAPKAPEQPHKEAPVVPEVQFKRYCRHCQGKHLEMLWGKYGYYFRCLDCQQNTAIGVLFPEFKEGYRVRKQGKHFFLEHEGKNTSELLHVNPET